MSRELSSYQRVRKMLHEGAELTYRRISEQLDLSKRQARRLIDQAIENGEPVQERREGREKVFFIPSESQVRDDLIDLTEQEILALCVAADAARASLGTTPLIPPLESAVEKLVDRIGNDLMMMDPEDDRDHWHFSSHPVAQVDPDIFRQLTNAVQSCAEIDISYDSASSGKHYDSRRLHPYTMVVRNGSWILLAWCHLTQEYREFSIPAVGNVRQTGGFFVRNEDLNVEEYFRNRFGGRGGDRVRSIELEVDARVLPYFQRKKYHASQTIRSARNGKARITFDVGGLDDIAAFIRSWGDSVRVIKPKELIERIADDASRVAGMYQRDGKNE